MSHAKEWSIRYDSSLVLAIMIYQPNEDDFLVFLLSALAQLNSCVFGESILEGYSLKSFRNNDAFLTHDREVDDQFSFFGENTIILSFFTC